MTRVARSRGVIGFVFIAGMLAVPGRALAQRPQNVAPGECTNCHDHDAQKEWALTRDGDGKGKQHFKAYQQLFEPKGAEYAEAVGLAKVNDPKGTCVTCHATLVQGKAKNGVTCQSCHGPGSLYLKPHQQKGAYQESLKLGLKDTVKNPKVWVEECLRCHVMGSNGDADARIVKAGHPDGSDFVIGSRLQFVSGPGHWNSKYTANEVNALGEPLRKSLLARLKQPSAPPPQNAAAGPATAAGAATPGGVQSAPPAPVSAPAAGAAPAASPAPAAGNAPAPPGNDRSGQAVVSPPAAAAPSPANPAGGTPAAATSPTDTSANRGGLPPPGDANAAPVTGAPTRALTDTGVEMPRRQPIPRAPAAVAATPPPDLPLTPAGLIGSIQGRLASLLDTLLARGVTLPKPVTPPQGATVYRGADADLIRLQEEIISLALEALASPPAKAPTSR